MKRYFCLLVLIISSLMFYSCKKVKSLDEISSKEINYDSNHIDLDLSDMNYNMFSSVTFDIMVAPEKYVNKRIKIAGNFYTSIYEGQQYFSAMIWDPTGCCPAGMDFIPPATMNYPEDFPEMDEKISVTGRLIYQESDGQKYLVFQADEITKL